MPTPSAQRPVLPYTYPPMVIKASAAGEIRKLVESLSNPDGVVREAAVARLAVIGARAVPHLIGAYEDRTDRSVRTAILRALEPIGDPRGGLIAAKAIREGGDVALAAVPVLVGLLDSHESTTGGGALDTLITVALDVSCERRLRLAAMAALHRKNVNLPSGQTANGERTPQTAPHAPNAGASEADAIWTDALDGHLPDDPETLRKALNARAASAPLSEMRKLVDGLRTREATAGSKAEAWRAVRGSLHQALAMRGSRVALYDVRETLQTAAAPLPPSFAAAAQLLGDRSCLEPIAAAYSRLSGDERGRRLLASAFEAIAAREKIGAGHAVMKRISIRWPDAANTLWRTRVRRQKAGRTSHTSR